VATLCDVQKAHARIRHFTRYTPLIKPHPLRENITTEAEVYLKLENLQITGSFKARGAVNKYLSLTPEEIARGFVTASGGNHGLGVAYAGLLAGSPVTVYLPNNTPTVKADKLRQWGAEVTFVGDVWDDANAVALEAAEREQKTYFHAFADPAVIAGQGTIALEILEMIPELDTILVAIGGGGLMSGVSLAVKALKPNVRVIGVEATGAPTLFESLKAGKLVELEAITTAANTLANRVTTQLNFDIIRQNVDDILLVTDDEMRDTAQWLWNEMGLAVELSSAAALAAIRSSKIILNSDQKACAIVCSAGYDGLPK
jgi:threonine dehydratase